MYWMRSTRPRRLGAKPVSRPRRWRRTRPAGAPRTRSMRSAGERSGARRRPGRRPRGRVDARVPGQRDRDLRHRGALPFQARARARLATLAAAGDRAAVSDLTRLECRVKPLRLGDPPLLADYETFFAVPDLVWLPLVSS